MALLEPYYPALVILIGAVVTAYGGFWAAKKQADFNTTLNAKNEEIIALQGQQIKTLTGGDSYPWVMPVFFDHSKLTMLVMNSGKYPLYGVQATIIDVDFFEQLIKKSDDITRDIASIHNQSQIIIKIGDLGSSQSSEIATFSLDQTVGTRNFTIYLLARNGQVNEEMRLRWVKDRWSVAYKAYNEKGILQENVSADYPSDQLWK